MSFYNLYVGDACDPMFHWDGGDHSANIPRVIVDLGSIGLMGCVEARSLLENPKYGGKVLDWGSSGARLSKERIMEFLKEFSAPLITRGPVLASILQLEDNKEYILFASEQ